MEEITQCSSAHNLASNTVVSAGGAPGTSVEALQQPDQRSDFFYADKEQHRALLS